MKIASCLFRSIEYIFSSKLNSSKSFLNTKICFNNISKFLNYE